MTDHPYGKCLGCGRIGDVDRAGHCPDGCLTGSAQQRAWQEVAQAVRVQLARHAAAMPQMTPDGLRAFVAACRDAVLFELDAGDYDNAAALLASRCTFEE